MSKNNSSNNNSSRNSSSRNYNREEENDNYKSKPKGRYIRERQQNESFEPNMLRQIIGIDRQPLF